jgi:hypothetical protein
MRKSYRARVKLVEEARSFFEEYAELKRMRDLGQLNSGEPW